MELDCNRVGDVPGDGVWLDVGERTGCPAFPGGLVPDAERLGLPIFVVREGRPSTCVSLEFLVPGIEEVTIFSSRG